MVLLPIFYSPSFLQWDRVVSQSSFNSGWSENGFTRKKQGDVEKSDIAAAELINSDSFGGG